MIAGVLLLALVKMNSISAFDMRSGRRFFSSPISPSLPSRWAPCSCPSNGWPITSSTNASNHEVSR